MLRFPGPNNYLFVDGAYLRTHFEHHMRGFYDCVPPMDFSRLSSATGDDVDGRAHRVLYYDAIDYMKDQSESDQQYEARIGAAEKLHSYVNSLPGFHVHDGHVRKSPRRRNREQKGVDVLLAVDAMEQAARGNMDLAILLAGDLDFEPLLSSLVRLGVRTRLAYVPQHTSQLLMGAADEIRKLTLEHFFFLAAPSFRANHKQVKIQYAQQSPEPPVFEVLKQGVWKRRRVTLFRPTNASPARLYVEAGDELSEPSYTFEYQDVDKLSLAFNLTFGDITWD